MTIEPIAYFRSPFASKFGIPRQSGLVDELRGWIEMCPKWDCAEALRGMGEFDYLWIIWGFSENVTVTKRPTVRPPRLGGNRHLGVFATRSSFRPNNLGLSSVRIVGIEGTRIEVAGADLMDGTPIFDIKPYVTFADSHPGARSGFVDSEAWTTLKVEISDELRSRIPSACAGALLETLAQDPRPHYHSDPQRVYGMSFGGLDVRFRVDGDRLMVTDVVAL